MLPSFLFPSYKQYKTDCDAVATWLANTAQQCGYSSDLLTGHSAAQQKAPKLKGRARKIARDAAKASSTANRSQTSSSTTKVDVPKYLIAIKDFISLAEWIVRSAKPLVEVPASFVTVLDRAITVRKRHNNWWYEQSKKVPGANKKENETNDSHGCFIGVLEKVREVLQPRIPTDLLKDPMVKPVGGAPAATEPTNGHFVNLFENLDIEEPSDAAAKEADPEEIYFAVHCFFNDYDNIRRYIQSVWEGYKLGMFDLVAASITTNTAIGFARSLKEDFEANFPEDKDFKLHVSVLYMQLCLANGQDPESKERPDDEMNFAVYAEADRILFPAYMLVSSFQDIAMPDSIPISKHGQYRVYDPKSNRATKSARDQFREDKIVLLEILPDFCVLALSRGIPAEDELTRGVREMVDKGDKLSISLAFAAQIFLDIHHVLRDQVSNGYDDLVKSARYVENNIQQVQKFRANLRVDTWPKSNDRGLAEILDVINHWVKTGVAQETQARMTQRSRLQPPPTESFQLLKRHPIYCGLLSYNIKISAQEVSIIFVNAWGSVLYCAHLYNAIRQEKLMTKKWQDLELALSMHRIEDMFIGDYPKTIDDYFKRFALAMGYSAANFAKNRRDTTAATASKAGLRGLNQISPVSAMFQNHYCGTETMTNFSPSDVETIIQKHADYEDDSDSERGEWTRPKIKINAPEAPTSPSASMTSSPLKRGRRKTPSFASGIRPIHLLNALLTALQSETLELTFDHFRLHTFSWRLLRTLKNALDEDLRHIYGASYIERENQLPFVVGYVLMTAVQTTRLAGVLLPKEKDVVSSRLLVKAASVVGEMLESGIGAIECKLLRDFMGLDVVFEERDGNQAQEADADSL